jgi:hypothetical protein
MSGNEKLLPDLSGLFLPTGLHVKKWPFYKPEIGDSL